MGMSSEREREGLRSRSRLLLLGLFLLDKLDEVLQDLWMEMGGVSGG
jgi:hypothetical protein